VTATLTRHYVWSGYVLTVCDGRSGLVYEYPVRFATRERGLAFAREAGVENVRVVEL
jgi:hypothetical protein